MLSATTTFSKPHSMEIVSRYHRTEDEIISEQEQVTAAKINPEKFEPLYNSYYEPVFRFVYQRLDSKDTAFDITQQVFLKALLNLKKYEYRGLPFSSWLYRIALNELNQLFRKNKNERALNVDIESAAELGVEMEEESSEEKIKVITRAVSLLPEGEMQLVEMRFFEKRSFKEIGEVLNITENNAKVRLYRVLDKLKKIISNR
jgi:RNA polymerase sigma-70 factor (ECF subfamily)